MLTGGFCLPVLAFSQEIGKVPQDSVYMRRQEMKAVQIPITTIRAIYPSVLSGLLKEEIEALNADDVAGLLTKAPGTTIKSYGGLGGLKSISIRGLGGQHTAILVDGFQITNPQAGQMNLGQLQADGLTSLATGSLMRFDNSLPVSAQFSSNFVDFKTFLYYRGYESSGVKASLRYGSFQRREAYVQGDRKKGKWHVGAFGKYRDANGAYPFEFTNGSTSVEGMRANNDYQDMHFGAKVGRDLGPDKTLNLYYRSSYIDQGLPGAVFFYNESADERMTTMDHRVMLDLSNKSYKNHYRYFLNAGANKLNYLDPTYLNAAGYLNNMYHNYSINGGYTHFRALSEVDLKWGGEQRIDMMQSNRLEFGKPLRSVTHALLGLRKKVYLWELEALAGGQFVFDQNKEGNQTHLQFTPNVRLLRSFKEDKMTGQFWYKRTFRLPSFNELYFGEVGNQHLQPEVAHQLNLSYEWRIKENYYKWRWSLRAEGYFNRVRNKIIAIPTKNLFVWSMQNVTEAAVYGGALETRAIRRFYNEARLEITANYTWQRVIDITPEALTYGHQVAYAPKHLANLDLMFVRKGITARISNNFVSGRYALNENVAANYLEPFWTVDAAIGYKYTWKEKHTFGVQFNARNLTNASYAFIRSYVMPGRHYLLTLNYEI